MCYHVQGCRGVDCYMLVGIDPITVTVALLGVLCMVALGVAHIRYIAVQRH